MDSYQPPEDYLSVLAGDDDLGLDDDDLGIFDPMGAMFHSWEGLSKTTKTNLHLFEQANYALQDIAIGDADIVNLVCHKSFVYLYN